MALDPSIPLQAKAPEPVNALTQLGQYANVSNALVYNKLLGIQQQRGQIGIKQDQTNLAQSQQNLNAQADTYVTQKLTGLLSDPDVTPEKAHQLLNEVAAKVPTVQTAVPTWQKAIDSTGGDPAKLRRLLTGALVGTLAGPEAVKAVFGTPTEQNNGGQIISGVTQSPINGGGFVPATATPTVLAPGQKATMVPTVNAEGQPGTVPLSTRVDDQGNPKGAAGPTGMGDGRFSSYAPPAVPQGGRAPTAYNPTPSQQGSAPAGQPQQPAQTDAQGNPPGFTPTGLAPTAAGSIEAYQKAQADVPQAVNRIAGLQKAYHALADINSGPGTGKWQQIRSTIQALSGGAINLSGDDTIQNYDLARKYMQDYANRATVGNTAEGLKAAEHANASTDISQGAALDVLRTNIGLERMAVAQTKLAQNPQAYLKDASNFATNNDRRAFAADLYTPEQLSKMVAGMKGEERARFVRSLGVAQRLGLLSIGGK